ncbi:MAG: type II secretion system protein [Candidatus Omnitrophota bacterium]
MKKAFTVFEILITMVIISVLGTLAVPAFMRSMEMTYDNNAKADLKLLSSAEKTYYIDMNSYYVSPYNDSQPQELILDLNNVLGLGLPAGANRKWNYETDTSGCVWATRYGGDSRTWHMAIGDADVSSGACS